MLVGGGIRMLIMASMLPVWLGLSGFLLPHPIHLSVTDIQYRADQKVFEISIKFFTDDLQEALGEKELLSPKLSAYVLAHIGIEVNEMPLLLEWVNQSHKADNITWVYLQARQKRPPKEVKVSNNVLMETFSDQRNIIYVQSESKRKSLLLEKGKATGEVILAK